MSVCMFVDAFVWLRLKNKKKAEVEQCWSNGVAVSLRAMMPTGFLSFETVVAQPSAMYSDARRKAEKKLVLLASLFQKELPSVEPTLEHKKKGKVKKAS